MFSPIKRIDLPKKVKFTGAKHYNEDQINDLIAALKGDIIEIIILCTVFYGLRRSEIMGLKWDAADFDNDIIIIKHTVVRANKVLQKMDASKNSSSYRSMPLAGIIKDTFKSIKAKQVQYKLLQPNDYIDEGYIFTREDGSPYCHFHHANSKFAQLF